MSRRSFFVVVCLMGIYLLNAGGPGILPLPMPGPVTPKSPVPGSGLHVLIIEDRMHRRELPPSQFDAIMSADVDELIRKNSGTKYVYDKNQDVSSKDDPWVKDAMKVQRTKLPWLVIDNNGRGSSEPFPSTPKQELKEFKAIVEKYLAP